MKTDPYLTGSKWRNIRGDYVATVRSQTSAGEVILSREDGHVIVRHPDDMAQNWASVKTHEERLADMRVAGAQLRARQETEFAAIDEAIATGRPVDPDHCISWPMENHEAEMRREIDRLKAENESLKIKLSRMCGDA